MNEQTVYKKGVIRTLKGLVIKVQFDEGMPDLNEMIYVDNEKKSPLLVNSLTHGDMAVCLNIGGDYSIQKGDTVTRSGRSLEIPVGEEMIGRVWDAMGRPIDGKPQLEQPVLDKMIKRPIFSPAFQETSLVNRSDEVLETGLKVLDFFTPFVKGRKIGIVGGAGVGKTVLTMEIINNTVLPTPAPPTIPILRQVCLLVLVNVSVRGMNCTRRWVTTTCSKQLPCSLAR